LGLPWGAMGVAISYVIANIVSFLPTFMYCFKDTPISVRDSIAVLFKPAVMSVAMGFLITLLKLVISGSIAYRLVMCFLLGSLLYMLFWIGLNGPKTCVDTTLNYIRVLYPKNMS
jgi:Na+-driven multidrug efflux pump